MASVLELILRFKKEGTGAKDTEKELSSLEKLAGKVSLAFIALGAAKVIKASTMLAARVETLGVVTKTLGANVGMTEGEIRSLEKAISDQGITLQASRQAIAMMIQANVDLASATDLARLAQDTAVIANLNSSEAFEQLTYVLQTGNVRMARTLGLNVQFGKAQKELADSLGIATDALSEEQIMQARTNAVMEAGSRISGTYTAALETAGKKMSSMPRIIEELSRGFGEQLLPALNAVVSVLYDLGTATLNAWDAAKELETAQNLLTDLGIDYNKILKEQGIELTTGGYKTKEYTDAIIELANNMKPVIDRVHDLRWQFESFPDIEIGVTGEEEIKADLETLSGIMSAWRRGEEEKLLIRARLAAIEAPTDVPTERITSDMEDAAIAASQVAIAAGDVSTWGAAKKLAEDYGAVLGDGRNTANTMYNHLKSIADMSPIEIEIITKTIGGIPRAGGGPVEAGRPYIVGEREAEVFVPNQAGNIYNQNQLAGGDVNINNGISQRAFNNMAEDFFRGLGG